MPSLVLIDPAVRAAIGNIQTDKQTYRLLLCRFLAEYTRENSLKLVGV